MKCAKCRIEDIDGRRDFTRIEFGTYQLKSVSQMSSAAYLCRNCSKALEKWLSSLPPKKPG
jgi:hypothetical protein